MKRVQLLMRVGKKASPVGTEQYNAYNLQYLLIAKFLARIRYTVTPIFRLNSLLFHFSIVLGGREGKGGGGLRVCARTYFTVDGHIGYMFSMHCQQLACAEGSIP